MTKEAPELRYREPQNDTIKARPRDAELLEARSEARRNREGPQVGDWVSMGRGHGFRRITHLWDDGCQLTIEGQVDSSFYMGKGGGGSFSGSLDLITPYASLQSTTEFRAASFWFFSQDRPGAHRSVHVFVPVRVWEFKVRESTEYYQKLFSKQIEGVPYEERRLILPFQGKGKQ